MNREEIEIYMSNLFAKKIRETIIRYHCNYLDQITSKEKYDIIMKLSSLTKELLNNKKIKIKFINLISKSSVNGDNPELRLATFEMIRNLNLHFPCFDNWNEVFIFNEMLTWDRKFSTIKSYFDENCGEKLNYDIFIKTPFGWEKRHTVVFTVPKLSEGKKIYLKDVISENDVIWTFCLIDSLLEYLGLNITDFSGYSM